MHIMQPYYDLMDDILTNGRPRDDRTGTGTIAVFGRQLRFNLMHGFPLLGLKYTNFEFIIAELLWFLEGSVCNERLKALGCPFWGQWAIANNDIALTREERVKLWDILHARKEGIGLLDKCKIEAFDNKLQGIEALVDGYLDDARVPTTRREYRVGDLGPIYGKQWRDWQTTEWDSSISEYMTHSVDQIQVLIDGLKSNPKSRRHIVNAWNVPDLPDESMSPQENVKQGRMSLAPCHPFWQCFVEKMTANERLNEIVNRGLAERSALYTMYDTEEVHQWIDNEFPGIPTHSLSLQLYQRSSDTAIGAPANIASYALLLMLLANECGYAAKEFIFNTGDTHIYGNHIESMREMLARDRDLTVPMLKLPTDVKISDYMTAGKATLADVKLLASYLTCYEHHPFMKLPVAV